MVLHASVSLAADVRCVTEEKSWVVEVLYLVTVVVRK